MKTPLLNPWNMSTFLWCAPSAFASATQQSNALLYSKKLRCRKRKITVHIDQVKEPTDQNLQNNRNKLF